MEKQLATYLRVLVFLFSGILFQQNLYAQNAADPDTTFGLGRFNNFIRNTAIQSDGKIVVGGDFTYYKSTPLNRIARLNPDGSSLDVGFNTGTGVNASVYSIVIQSDGKIIIGGGFTNFNGTTRSLIHSHWNFSKKTFIQKELIY